MNSKSAIIWICVIALSCFLLGALTTRFLLAGEEAGPESSYIERLHRDLGLSDSQKRTITDCLADEDRAIGAILERYRGPASVEIDRVRAETKEKILKVLDPGQRKIFEGGE